MPVTEYALIKLQGSHDELELLEVVMQCQELQDGWMRQHQPDGIDHGLNLSTMYIQQDIEPPCLLITAPWDTPDAHTQWLQSSENQSGFGKMSEYITPGGDSVLLFHMDPAGAVSQLKGQMLSQDSFRVCRISAEPGQKETLQKIYQSLESDLGPGQTVWAGWRIEKAGDAEDLVVFSSTNVSDEQLRPLISLSSTTDTRFFKNMG